MAQPRSRRVHVKTIHHLKLERLREVLDYNPWTGDFKWKFRTGPMCKLDRPAGSIKVDGYRKIRLDGRIYQCSHLAWLYHYGVAPTDLIDHKNGDRGDNRIENLRLTTHCQNSMNIGVTANSSTGLKGASRYNKPYTKAKFISTITVNRERIFLGLFMTAEEAHEAYRKMAVELHGEFARMTKEVDNRTPFERTMANLHSKRIRSPGNKPVTERLTIMMSCLKLLQDPDVTPDHREALRRNLDRAAAEVKPLLSA